jgi:carbon monoxide dehydrogenase subunit G
MAIEIEEKFEVEAPIDVVWQFLMEPDKIVGCLPGASLLEVVDERNFLGRVKIKLGAVTAAYKGKIEFQDVDAERHVLVMLGEGKDPSGGTARAEITVRLAVLESGWTEMTTLAKIDLTGKVMQVGGGMIKGVSHQLFQRFAKSAKQQLEAEGAVAAEDSGSEAGSMPVPAEQDEALSIIPLLFQTLGAAISNFFRRIFGGGQS